MKLAITTAAMVLSLGAIAANATTTIGGIDFADNAFADALYFSSGTFTTSGGTLTDVLTDIDAGTYAFSTTTGANVILGFTDNDVFNLAGADIAVFEVGVPDTIQLTFGTQTLSYLTTYTGFSAGRFNLNVALIDFSDFGIAAGANLTYQSFILDAQSSSGTVPSLSLVGALHTVLSPVPEPDNMTLLLSGLSIMGLVIRRRHT